jgi:hypothetical protein
MPNLPARCQTHNLRIPATPLSKTSLSRTKVALLFPLCSIGLRSCVTSLDFLSSLITNLFCIAIYLIATLVFLQSYRHSIYSLETASGDHIHAILSDVIINIQGLASWDYQHLVFSRHLPKGLEHSMADFDPQLCMCVRSDSSQCNPTVLSVVSTLPVCVYGPSRCPLPECALPDSYPLPMKMRYKPQLSVNLSRASSWKPC